MEGLAGETEIEVGETPTEEERVWSIRRSSLSSPLLALPQGGIKFSRPTTTLADAFGDIVAEMPVAADIGKSGSGESGEGGGGGLKQGLSEHGTFSLKKKLFVRLHIYSSLNLNK